MGTAEDFFFRRDALRALMYPRIRSVRYRSATQAVYSTQSAAQGELPEGQEKVPWGIAVLRNLFARCAGRHLRIYLIYTIYPHRCCL